MKVEGLEFRVEGSGLRALELDRFRAADAGQRDLRNSGLRGEGLGCTLSKASAEGFRGLVSTKCSKVF